MFQQFALLKDLPEDQLEAILAINDIYSKVTKSDLESLPEININNFINICNFVDYYQLMDTHEFLENIRYHILIKTPKVIDNINKLPVNMIHKIYDHECIPNMKCRYNYPYDINIKHICCYRLLAKYKKLMYYSVDHASRDGSLELVKYLFKIGKLCTINAIDNACGQGHLEVVKYLFEVKHKDCSIYAITSASHNNHLEIIKYLIEIQNKKYTSFAKDIGSKQVLAYLLTKPDSFIQ